MLILSDKDLICLFVQWKYGQRRQGRQALTFIGSLRKDACPGVAELATCMADKDACWSISALPVIVGQNTGIQSRRFLSTQIYT